MEASFPSVFGTRPGYRWLVLGAVTAVTFLFGIFFSFGVFLDPLIAEFGWSSALTSFIFSIYSVSYSLSVILMGRLADRYGARETIGLGGVIVVLALLLSSRADAVWELYLTFGVGGGIGAAGFWVPSTKAVMEYFSADGNLNLAVSVVSIGTGAGTLVIAPLAGLFVVEYGWRECYLLFSLITALICTVAVLVVKRPRDGVRPPRDATGAVPGQRLREAIRTGNFWSLFGIYVLGSGIGRYTVMVYLAVILVAAGFPLQTGAICLGLVGGGTILSRTASGVLAKRLRERRVVFASFALQGLATFALIFSGSSWVAYSSALAFGIGYGGYVPQFPILTRNSFGMRSYGIIYGVISSGLGIGALIGPPVLGGYLFGASGSYFLTLALSGTFSMVASAMALLIKSGS